MMDLRKVTKMPKYKVKNKDLEVGFCWHNPVTVFTIVGVELIDGEHRYAVRGSTYPNAIKRLVLNSIKARIKKERVRTVCT